MRKPQKQTSAQNSLNKIPISKNNQGSAKSKRSVCIYDEHICLVVRSIQNINWEFR